MRVRILVLYISTINELFLQDPSIFQLRNAHFKNCKTDLLGPRAKLGTPRGVTLLGRIRPGTQVTTLQSGQPPKSDEGPHTQRATLNYLYTTHFSVSTYNSRCGMLQVVSCWSRTPNKPTQPDLSFLYELGSHPALATSTPRH